MDIRKNDRGIAHPLFIVLAVVVIAAIGFAGWKVFGNKKDTKTIVNSSGQTVTVDASAADKAAEKSCNDALHDKTLCKFAANFEMPKAYEATITTTASSGTSTTTMSVDGHDNTKMAITKDGKETMATILLNGDTYIKDVASGNWIKYPKSSDSSSSSSSTSDSVKFDKTNWTESGTTSYKAAGKEACGSLTCYKYQVTDTKSSGSTQYFWFDNKDYMMRRLSVKDSSGTNDMTFSYKAVNITVPSPVVDYTAAAASDFDASSILSQIESATGTDTSQ